MANVETFIKNHNLHSSTIDIDALVEVFIDEMKNGLEGEESSLEMIPTYIQAESEFKKGDQVLAVDAGGTNFRAALVSFKENGKIEIGDIDHKSMPGIDHEISAKEFFDTIADYIDHLVTEVKKIGFCFSYAVEIFPNKDGRLLTFSKEVKAPEVVGKMIGKSLLEALETPEKDIVLLNDTVATLLAGKSATSGKSYDSFIGFILGTGTNTCYIEKNKNILKKSDLDQEESQVINMETGNFAKAPRTDIDIKFDDKTTNPGTYTFEKMFAGGYFGGLCLASLKAACDEDVFSDEASDCIKEIESLSTEQVNDFVLDRNPESNILNSCIDKEEDREACFKIIDTLVDRASLLVAANIAAVVLKTGKGKSADRPILITVEGTTFYKLRKFRERFENYLDDFLSGEKERYVEFAKIEHSSLLGAALAAQIN